MHIMSCRWGWSGPDYKARYPTHAAAIEPDMRCIRDGHWPSRGWSQTGPAQCVALHTGPAAAHRRLALPAHALLRHMQHGGAAVCFTTNRPHDTESSTPSWPQCSTTLWGMAKPGHQQPVHALCSVMQQPCSDDNEATTRCRVLPRRRCHLLSIFDCDQQDQLAHVVYTMTVFREHCLSLPTRQPYSDYQCPAKCGGGCGVD
jgi:hypothetical protein